MVKCLLILYFFKKCIFLLKKMIRLMKINGILIKKCRFRKIVFLHHLLLLLFIIIHLINKVRKLWSKINSIVLFCMIISMIIWKEASYDKKYTNNKNKPIKRYNLHLVSFKKRKVRKVRNLNPRVVQNLRECLLVKNKKNDWYFYYHLNNKTIIIHQYQSSNLYLLLCEILSLILLVFMNYLSLYLKDMNGFWFRILPNILTLAFYIYSICFFLTVTLSDLVLSIPYADFLFFLLILVNF